MSANRKATAQNFLFLASIQIASIGLPSVSLGNFLSKEYGVGTTICSIFIGNLILWLIGTAVISMTDQLNINGIQNIKNYIGKTATVLFSSILSLSFFAWYIFQIKSSALCVSELFHWTDSSALMPVGLGFGLLSALFAIGGIRLFKWLSVFSIPFLVFYIIYQFFQSTALITGISWGLSFPAVLTSVLSFLPGIIMLPTFFRYSTSRANSFLALSIFILVFSIFQCFSIWMSFKGSAGGILTQESNASLFYVLCTLLFILITSTCNNLLNIYFVSACYETLISKFSGVNGFVYIGLLGTIAFGFGQITSQIEYLLDLFNSYMLSLGVTLLIAFLIRVIVKHRPRPLEKWINFIGWLVGCVAGTISKMNHPQDEIHYLLIGIGCTSLFFLFLIFIEESIWAFRQLYLQKAKK